MVIHGDEAVTTTESPAVRKWLDAIGETSRATSLWHFETFIKWARVNDAKFGAMSPDELVEYVLDGSVRDVNQLLDLKKRYLQEMTGSQGHKENANQAVTSFFKHNRAPLPRDATLRIRADKGHDLVEGTLSPEEIKRVVLASDRMYQAVFQVILCAGLGKDEFIRWSDAGMEQLDGQLGGDLVRVAVAGRKAAKGVYNYHTYVGGDALVALRRYLATVRPGRAAHAKAAPTAIFLNQWGKPLSKAALYWYWTRKTKRLGIAEPEKHRREVPRYGKNLHEIRDVFRTLWRKSGVPVEYGEYFMGHEDAFDKYGYDKTHLDEGDLRARYLKALPWLCLLTRNEPYDLVDRREYENEEVQKLRAQVEELTGKVELVNRLLENPATVGLMWDLLKKIQDSKD